MSTTTSDDHSRFRLIFLPVFFSLPLSCCVYIWRRLHSDMTTIRPTQESQGRGLYPPFGSAQCFFYTGTSEPRSPVSPGITSASFFFFFFFSRFQRHDLTTVTTRRHNTILEKLRTFRGNLEPTRVVRLRYLGTALLLLTRCCETRHGWGTVSAGFLSSLPSCLR
ncbi:hypothetical protein VTJ49DRAFT_3708 [Mycothermus thermophilus]|uniref:Secreted protein n=1 Tax=Humicola insolens TaxID=85995 RepID=A0ABR3VNB9_HUMIN